jgi:hypothetical protein
VAGGGRVDPSNVHVRTVGSMFLCHCGMGSEYVPVLTGKIGSVGSVRISKRSSEPVRSGTELAMAPSLTVSRIIVNLFLSLRSYGRALDATFVTRPLVKASPAAILRMIIAYDSAHCSELSSERMMA